MRFQSILIITYARTGSTLLQGILNGIDGIVIRGENYNMCFHYFMAYKSIQNAKVYDTKSPSNPFFGGDQLDENYFIESIKNLLKTHLIGDAKNIRCYGFKEIRHLKFGEGVFEEYMSFLRKVFPEACFIFNTRNLEKVVASCVKARIFQFSQYPHLSERIEILEQRMSNYAAENPDHTYQIDYSDVVGQSLKFQEMFDFLGVPYNRKKIESILKVKHSFKSNPAESQKDMVFNGLRKDKILAVETQRIMDATERTLRKKYEEILEEKTKEIKLNAEKKHRELQQFYETKMEEERASILSKMSTYLKKK